MSEVIEDLKQQLDEAVERVLNRLGSIEARLEQIERRLDEQGGGTGDEAA